MSFINIFVLVFLVLFLVVFILRSLLLRARGVRVLAAGVGKKGFAGFLERFFLPPMLLWMAAVVFRSLVPDHGFMQTPVLRDLFQSPPLQAAGCLLLVLGLGMFVAALFSFGTSWRIGVDTQNPGSLVTRGAFALSRNPIFLSMDLYFLGLFFIYPSPFFLVSAALALSGFHYQILQEERFLRGHYGEDYRQYTLKVGRYL